MARKRTRRKSTAHTGKVDVLLDVPFRTVVILGIVLAVVLYGLWMTYRADYVPGFVFLRSAGDAQWIRLPQPQYDLDAHPYSPVANTFRTRVTVTSVLESAELRFRALRQARVSVDGREVFATDPKEDQWKDLHGVALSEILTPGEHELRIDVMNTSGPPLLQAYCESLGLHTGSHWEASSDGQRWARAALAMAPRRSQLAERFPSVPQALRAKLPFFVVVFASVAGWWMLRARRENLREKDLSPGTTRRVVLGLVTLLGLNNILRFPSYLGFDSQAHVEYIRFIMENWRIPLANEGWQLFQSPFYYMAALPVYAFFNTFFGSDTAISWLRVLSLLAGLALIEASFRAIRTVYPDRTDLQTIGTIFAGCLPMNLYIAHHPGNETLAGLLSAIVVLLMCERFATPAEDSSPRALWPVGLFLGLAILTKVTAVLLIPLVVVALWYTPRVSDAGAPTRLRVFVRTIGTVIGLAILVSGWYYVRNWIILGKPFMGGWDPARGIEWWQGPGYRHLGQLLRFGEALAYPMFAGTVSFLDGNYATLWSDSFISGQGAFEARPPWNYGFMAASVGLALLPTFAIIIGVVFAFRKSGPPQTAVLFSVLCVFLYGLALLHHFLTVPFYCTTKAFYMLGIMPCLVLLGTAGFDFLTRNRFVRPVVYGLFACWAVAAYLSYLSV